MVDELAECREGFGIEPVAPFCSSCFRQTVGDFHLAIRKPMNIVEVFGSMIAKGMAPHDLLPFRAVDFVV